MKLLTHNVGVLSNAELLSVLAERGAFKGTGRALASEKMAYHYLSTQPTRRMNTKELEAFYDALQGYGLSKGELLQLANLAPRTAVEVHLAVADCEARLGEDGVGFVIEMVEKMVYRDVAAEEG